MFARKTLSFLLISIALLSGLAGRSQAQVSSFAYATQDAIVTLDKNTGVQVSLSAYTYATGDAAAPLFTFGSVLVTGAWGNFNFTLNTSVATARYWNYTKNRVPHKRALLQSIPFPFKDTNGISHTSYLQMLVSDENYGTMRLQVVDAITGVTLMASADTSGRIVDMPVLAGTTSIYWY